MDKGRDMVVDIDKVVVGRGRVVDKDKVVGMNMVECCTYIVDLDFLCFEVLALVVELHFLTLELLY